ncbi:hypothetical protein [Aquisediminimonas sediminicola]|uniref:hypothetical protein n=1 Tax=Alteraquisediminimonas sediminicola TaxID=2676787 RepID=UPI001C8DE91B|nr:hypothetical protein [Aquisediminimonas sediminicola]
MVNAYISRAGLGRHLFKSGASLAALMLLTACGGSNAPALKPLSTPVIRAQQPVSGLIGRTEAEIVRQLGTPTQENIESGAKRLQFSRNGCVIDTYLFPLRANGQLVVTHVDSRRVTGEDLNLANCLKLYTGR